MKKFAIVTGASAGIGEATALALGEKGYDLWLMARRKQNLKKLAEKIQGVNGSVQVHVDEVDLMSTKSISEVIQQREELAKAVTVLINNAGLAKGIGKFADTDWRDSEQMMQTNVMGLMFLTREMLPYLMRQKSAHILNMGSVAGRWVYPGGAVYCASKFAVRAFSEGLRQDLMGSPVRVSNIEPGMVESEFSIVRLGSKEKADSVYQGMRPLTAKDIAETILWVLERPVHVNVQELVIFPTDQPAVGMVHRQK